VFYPSNGFFGAIVSRQMSTAWVDGATWVPEGSARRLPKRCARASFWRMYPRGRESGFPNSSNPLPVSNDGDQGHAISVSASIPRRRECAIQWKHAEASRYVSPSWIQRSGPLQSMCYRQGQPG
jgi:hypothetical protein